MFADIKADAYVLVDGDDTYDAEAASEMVALLLGQRLDMVTGLRVTSIAYRILAVPWWPHAGLKTFLRQSRCTMPGGSASASFW